MTVKPETHIYPWAAISLVGTTAPNWRVCGAFSCQEVYTATFRCTRASGTVFTRRTRWTAPAVSGSAKHVEAHNLLAGCLHDTQCGRRASPGEAWRESQLRERLHDTQCGRRASPGEAWRESQLRELVKLAQKNE